MEVAKISEENKTSDGQQLFVVYSIKMINYLIKQGNYMVKMADSDRDITGKYKVGLFEETEKLHKDMARFGREQSKKNRR